MTTHVTHLVPPDDTYEMAAVALHSLPADHRIAPLGDDWLRVRDVHEALTTGVMDALSVLDCLHFAQGGSLLRPDLVPAADRLLGPPTPPAPVWPAAPVCLCGHASGFHMGAYGRCGECACPGWRLPECAA